MLIKFVNILIHATKCTCAVSVSYKAGQFLRHTALWQENIGGIKMFPVSEHN